MSLLVGGAVADGSYVVLLKIR